MAEINLTQAEADALIAMEKQRVDDSQHDYPSLREAIAIPLQSRDRHEKFILDVQRSRIDLLKVTHQNRARSIVVLVRLDLGGPPHRNPDGREVPCPHLHVYREGFGDKWAIPAPLDRFTNTSDLWDTLQHFMSYCNVVEPPIISRGLFI